MIQHASSGKLTIYLLLFLLFIFASGSLNDTESTLPLAYVLSALLLNLSASLLINFRSLKRKPGLLIFHAGLILIVIFSGWGKLVYFKGYFEIEEDGIFEGNFLHSQKGPLYRPELMTFAVGRERAEDRFSDEKGREIYSTRLNFYDENIKGGSVLLEEGRPASYEGYDFFLLRKNHGVSIYLTYKAGSANTQDQTIGMNIPFLMPRSTGFSIPGIDEKIRVTLIMDNYEYKKPDAKIPKGMKIMLQFSEQEPETLQMGGSVPYKGGTLILSDRKIWDGIQVTYYPEIIYLAIISFISLFGLMLHFTERAAGSNPYLARIKESLLKPDNIIKIMIIAITLMTFWRTSLFHFVWDDNGDIVRNPKFNPVTVNSLLDFWREPFLHLYIPLTYTIWGVIAAFSRLISPETGGLFPGYFHIANVFFHTVNTLTVYVLIKTTFTFPKFRSLTKRDHSAPKKKYPELAAGFGALFFALHPSQVEPVVWIDGLRSLLSGLFSLTSVFLYLLFLKRYTSPEKTDRLWLVYGFSTTLFILALLSKPSSVTIPFVILSMAIFLTGEPVKRCLKPLLPWLSLAAATAIITKAAQPDSMIKLVTPIWARPLVAVDSLSFYMLKILFPFNNIVDYGRTTEKLFNSGEIFYSWTLPLTFIIVLGFLKWRKLYTVPSAIFLFGALPTLGLIPFSAQHLSNVSDRYIYLAMLGPAVFISWALFKRGKKRDYIFLVLLIALYGIKDSVIKWHWKTGFTMFSHVVDVNPESFLGHHILGSKLLDAGRLDEADRHFAKMAEIRPSYLATPHSRPGNPAGNLSAAGEKPVKLDKSLAIKYNQLGNKLMAQKRFREAEAKYKNALKIDPDMAQIYNNLGVVLDNLRKYDEAIAEFKKGLTLDPDRIELYINLAIALGDKGRHTEAEKVLRDALKRDENNPVIHNNLGISLVEQRKTRQGKAEFRKALELDPDYEEATYNLGYAGRYDENDNL